MTLLESPTLQQRIDPVFAAFGAPDSPGCAVAVARAGECLFSSGYGLASVEHQVPVTPQTVFRIASVTKQFTVTAVLMLAAAGRLKLDDDVRSLVPELAALRQRVSLEHLMRNTSGLPDFLELLRLGGLSLEARLGRAAMLQCIARNTHLNFEPGSRFLYSNSNFLLLGLIVERVTGCSLDAFLQEHVFVPLGMRSTALVEAGDVPVAGLATPYVRDDKGAWRRAMHGFEHGGEGGLVSCAGDLLLWLAELDKPTRLSADLLAQLSSPTRLNNGTPSPYLRGLEHSSLDGMSCMGHGGLWPGFRTELLFVADAQLGVVVVSNAGNSNPYRLARQVARLALLPSRPVASSPAARPLAAMTGTWLCSSAPALFDLALTGDEPWITQWGIPFVLEAQADGCWLPLRGAYEFSLRVRDAHTLEVGVGAGESQRFERLPMRAPADADLPGRYVCADNGAHWDIAAATDRPGECRVQVRGPHAAGGKAWRLCGVVPGLVEVVGQSSWTAASQLAQVQRDTLGQIVALQVFSSRIRGLRFVRV